MTRSWNTVWVWVWVAWKQGHTGWLSRPTGSSVIRSQDIQWERPKEEWVGQEGFCIPFSSWKNFRKKGLCLYLAVFRTDLPAGQGGEDLLLCHLKIFRNFNFCWLDQSIFKNRLNLEVLIGHRSGSDTLISKISQIFLILRGKTSLNKIS